MVTLRNSLQSKHRVGLVVELKKENGGSGALRVTEGYRNSILALAPREVHSYHCAQYSE